MKTYEMILIGIGLSMDAFAVAICKGLAMKKANRKVSIIIASYFGFFQAFMPICGYFLGTIFEKYILAIDHWVAFIFLCVIGGNMIRESFKKTIKEYTETIETKTMLLLSIATSIDAFTVGMTFGILKINIWQACFVIGLITFLLSFIGVKIGAKFGNILHKKAEFTGRNSSDMHWLKNII